MRYLMIHYLDENAALDPAQDPDAEGSAAAIEMQDWVAEMEASGVKVSGAALRPSREGRTVRERGGELLVSDGPFAETKEQIAGIDMLECASLDEAVAIASRHPTVRIGVFELREFLSLQVRQPAAASTESSRPRCTASHVSVASRTATRSATSLSADWPRRHRPARQNTEPTQRETSRSGTAMISA
jgi:hypothetical protein